MFLQHVRGKYLTWHSVVFYFFDHLRLLLVWLRDVGFFLRKIRNVSREKLQTLCYEIMPLSHKCFLPQNWIDVVSNNFYTRHHLILVLINQELLAVFEQNGEEFEFDWPMNFFFIGLTIICKWLANGMVGWSLYIVWPFHTSPTTLTTSTGSHPECVLRRMYQIIVVR